MALVRHPAVHQPAGAWLSVTLLIALLIFAYQWLLRSSSISQQQHVLKSTRVAFLTIGLGPAYFDLAMEQVAATERHFCVGQPYSVHSFVFTDQMNDTNAALNFSVTYIFKKSQGWPRDSDERFTWLGEVRPFGRRAAELALLPDCIHPLSLEQAGEVLWHKKSSRPHTI